MKKKAKRHPNKIVHRKPKVVEIEPEHIAAFVEEPHVQLPPIPLTTWQKICKAMHKYGW